MCKTGPRFLQERSVVFCWAMKWSSVPAGTLSRTNAVRRKWVALGIEERVLGTRTFLRERFGQSEWRLKYSESVPTGTLHCVTRELASSECSYGNTLLFATPCFAHRDGFWLKGRVRFSNAAIRKCSYGNTDAEPTSMLRKIHLTKGSTEYDSEKCSYKNTL